MALALPSQTASTKKEAQRESEYTIGATLSHTSVSKDLGIFLANEFPITGFGAENLKRT